MIEMMLLAALVMLLILKAAGLEIPWGWVLAPVWIPAAALTVMLAAVEAVQMAKYLTEKRKRRIWRKWKQ